MVSRRRLLVTGGASLLLLGGGFGGYVMTRSVEKARQPWSRAGESFGDPRLDALAYAILAPNPHNLQPWQVRLDGDDGFTLFCDPDRRLPETDPPNRQIVIGLGAFLELFRQAAAEKGYHTELEPFPEGEPQPVLDNRPIARVRIAPDLDIGKDPLFPTALDRRTMRVPFDSKPVERDMLTKIGSMALTAELTGDIVFNATEDTQDVAWHKKIHSDGWNIEMENKPTHMESVKWTRNGSAEVNANPDGVALYGPMLETLAITGLSTKEDMAKPGSASFNGTRDFYNGLIETAQAFGWMTSAGNSRAEQLQTGAAWLRLHQAATKLGVAMHPLSHVLQEFPAMSGLYEKFHAKLGVAAPARVQGLFRLGYAAEVGPAPRWPLESRLIEA